MAAKPAAILAAALLLAGLPGAPDAVEAAVCARPEHVVFYDSRFNTRIDIASATKTVLFQTTDGRVLTASPVKIVDDGRHVTLAYLSPELGIEARADLALGRVRAKAVEIVKPPPPLKPKPGQPLKVATQRTRTKTWLVTLYGGPSQSGTCGKISRASGA